MNIDLHVHSNLSDGAYSIDHLLNLSKTEWGLDLLAFTDHNTIDNLTETIEKGKKINLKIISGVEIYSRIKQKSVHLLGYNFDPNHRDLKNSLEKLQNHRKENILAIVQALKKDGFIIDQESLINQPIKYYGLVSVIRELYKNEINLKKISKEAGALDLYSIINYYFASKRKYYRPEKKLTARRTIELIKSAGGFVSLAHPGVQLKNDQSKDIIHELKKIGLEALEVFTPLHTWDQINYFQHLAFDLKLKTTIGSNFHEKVEDKNILINDPHQYFLPKVIDLENIISN